MSANLLGPKTVLDPEKASLYRGRPILLPVQTRA